MSLESNIPFVEQKMEQKDGDTRRFQRLSCTAAGCDCHKDFTVNGKPKPA